MKGRWLLVGVSAAALLPVIGLLLVIFWMGFWQSGPGEPVVYTLNHYRNILTDSFTFKTLLNTLGFASTTVVVSLFFAVPIAWLVERTDLPGKELVFTLMAVGALVPTFFTAMGWVFLLHPRIGVVNRIFVDSFGLAQGPFNIASIIGMGWVEGLGLILYCIYHDRGDLPHHGSVPGRSRQNSRLEYSEDPSLRHLAADVPWHPGRGDLCLHHRAFRLRGPGDHRHVEQDFYLLDFYLLQDAAAGGVA